jgi:hypothetical protein
MTADHVPTDVSGAGKPSLANRMAGAPAGGGGQQAGPDTERTKEITTMTEPEPGEIILPDGWSPFDPGCPPYAVDELGHFAGWLTEAEIEANDAAYAEAIAEQEDEE